MVTDAGAKRIFQAHLLDRRAPRHMKSEQGGPSFAGFKKPASKSSRKFRQPFAYLRVRLKTPPQDSRPVRHRLDLLIGDVMHSPTEMPRPKQTVAISVFARLRQIFVGGA
jgi:hypothetical protein